MKNARIARELVRIAKSLIADDDEFKEIAKKHGDVDKKVIKDMELSYSGVADYGDPHTYSIRELYQMWLNDKSAHESYSDFEGWLDDITSKNGTCEWIYNIREELYSIDDVDGYTVGEAESIAKQKPEAEILDSNSEQCKLCAWCEELYPESELQEEASIGLLCDYCIQAIESRGEKLKFKEEY